MASVASGRGVPSGHLMRQLQVWKLQKATCVVVFKREALTHPRLPPALLVVYPCPAPWQRVQSAHPHPAAPAVLTRIQVQNKTQSAVGFLKDNATVWHVHVQPAACNVQPATRTQSRSPQSQGAGAEADLGICSNTSSTALRLTRSWL